MSIKTTNTIDVEVDTTEVITSSSNDLVTSNEHTLHVRNLDSIISGTKKEYSIVGDGFYASVGTDQAPEWLTSIIDSVVEDSVRAGFVNYNELVGDVRAAIDSIDIAENTYVKTINFNTLADARIGTAVETLNATIDNVAATIVSIDTVQATASSAVSSSISDIRAEFEGNDARITGIEIAYADADKILTNSINSLSGRLDSQDGTLSGTADAIEGLRTRVGLSDFNNPDGTGLLARVSVLENQNDGVIEYTTGSYDVMINVSQDDTDPDDDQLDLTQEPYVSWVADEVDGNDESVRSLHVGDVYIQYDGTSGAYIKSYKFIKTAQDTISPFSTDSKGYTWALITDSDSQSAYVAALNAADLADQKRRVFVNTTTITTPFAPYDKGDLWVDSTTSPSVVKVATIPRANTYAAGDWVVADEQAQYFIDNTYSPDSATIHRQLDGKIEYRFYDTYADVKTPQDVVAINEADALDIIDNAWTTQELKDYANGNIVYFKDTTNAYWYQASTPDWLAVSDTSMFQALQDAATAKGAADGKVSQFYAWGGESAPADYDIVITPEVLDENDNVVQVEVTKTVSANNFLYWYKTDGILYYKPSTDWAAVPSSAGTGNTYISEGDIVTVFDPADGDISNYSYNGTAWQATGPTGIISQSSYFLDLDTAVRGPNGVAQGLVDLNISSQAYTNTAVTGVTNKFEYDSAIYLNGAYYKSGFGMNTVGVVQNEGSTADGITPEAAFDSEFYVNAERFILKSPSYPELQAVFQVTSTGISLGVEHTEATRNEPRGSYAALTEYVKGDIVTFNNSSYVALVTVTGVTPGSDGTKWQLLAAQGASPLLYEFEGTDNWPTDTTSASADEHTFPSSFAGNAIIRILAYDAEGGVRLSLNDGTEIPFSRSLADNTEEWYEFSFNNLIAGDNVLKIWSTTSDGGSIKKIEVAFSGADGLSGRSVDFLFIRSATEPTTLPSEDDNWKTDVTQVATGAGDLWSIKEVTPSGGGAITYEGLRVIDAPIIRELSIYSIASTSDVDKPTTSVYDFSTDSLTINSTDWSRSVSGMTAPGQKIYVSTALVTGNVTETDKAITWSEPSIYAQRQDGISPDALTVTKVKDGDTTTLTFSNGTIATIKDGDLGNSVTAIYSSDALGTVQSLEQGTKEYVNYYEYSGTLTLPIADLTFVKYVGEDGDSEGVIPIYADDTDGTNATLTFNNQGFVNFYEWTGSAPTTAPAGLTYVKFVGTDADVYKYVYQDSITKPTSKPTDNAATGWLTAIPASVNNTLWQSIGIQSKGLGDFTWSEVVQITAKDGLSALLFEWSGSISWPVSTTLAGAHTFTFDSAFTGNAFIRINASDAEGGLNLALNGQILGPLSGDDNQTRWYEFGADNLVTGANTISLWSYTTDGGSINEVKVAFVGAQGVTGDYTDYLFTRNTETPTQPIVLADWYTSVSSVPAGAGKLWSIKKLVTNGGGTTSYSDLRTIEADIVREVVLFSDAVDAAPEVPTTEVTYNFATDTLTESHASWSTSFPSSLPDGKKVYRITALASGNITETAVSLNGKWSTAVVYAQREDGDNGSSAYQLWTAAGNTGTETEFLDSLKAAEMYFHIRYSNNADGTGFNDVPTDKIYVGIYVGTSVTAPTDKDSYEWSRAKGENGYTPVKGTDYSDGIGSYVSYVFIAEAAAPGVPTGGIYNGTTETMPTTTIDDVVVTWSDDPVVAADKTTWVSKRVYTQTLVNGVASATWTGSAWSTPSKFFEKGSTGTAADNYKEIFLYQTATAVPTVIPTNLQGFTPSSGNALAFDSNNWTVTSTAPDTADKKIYRINLTVRQTDNEGNWSAVDSAWNGPVVITGINGNSATSYKEIFLYKNATSSPTVPGVAGSFTEEGAASANDGWYVSAQVLAAGEFTWRSSLTIKQVGSTGNWTNSDTDWNTPVKLTGDPGASVKGDRGTATFYYSNANIDNSDPASLSSGTIASYWDIVSTANYAEEKVGDVLIVTNTHPTEGWTHIYEYAASGWVSGNNFIINGNQIVNGSVVVTGNQVVGGELDAGLLKTGYIQTKDLDNGGDPSLVISPTYSGTIIDENGVRVYNNGVLRVKIGNLGT